MKIFNLIVTGYGGQGVLSLAEIIGKAALKERNDVKQVELHGLAQRGGPLVCHVRFGENVYSPLIRKAGADLIIGLEALEALRACYHSSKKKTVVLTDSKVLNPLPMIGKRIGLNEVLVEVKKFAKKVEVVNASEIVKKLTGESAMTNIFMLGYAINKKILPIKKETAWNCVAEKIRPQFWEMNKKVFEEAFRR